MHPKIAGGIFGIIYSILGLIIEKIFNINLFDNVLFYIVLVVLDLLVYKYFADRYDGDRSV